MGVKVTTGNIFTAECDTLVNTVNCDGFMGKGIALEFALRHPAMVEQYKQFCASGQLRPGKLWRYTPSADALDHRQVLNFPTKDHWKAPSKRSYLHDGLRKFVEQRERRGIGSIAFPTLGASNGGIPENESVEIMLEHLEGCSGDVMIYKFDPEAEDDVIPVLRERIRDYRASDELAEAIGLNARAAEALWDCLMDGGPCIRTLGGLVESVDGFGRGLARKVYQYVKNRRDGQTLERPDARSKSQPGFAFEDGREH